MMAFPAMAMLSFLFSIGNEAESEEWIRENIREKLKMVSGGISYDLFLNKLGRWVA